MCVSECMLSVCMFAGMCMYVNIYIYIYIYIHTYIYSHIHMCALGCMYTERARYIHIYIERERERERETHTEKEREREERQKVWRFRVARVLCLWSPGTFARPFQFTGGISPREHCR